MVYSNLVHEVANDNSGCVVVGVASNFDDDIVGVRNGAAGGPADMNLDATNDWRGCSRLRLPRQSGHDNLVAAAAA